MKNKVFLSALMAVAALSVNATVWYCNPALDAEGKDGGQGENWEDAFSFSMLREGINDVLEDGDTVLIKGGTIAIPSSAKQLEITKSGITLIGGFDPNATGVATSMPIYPSATPTIFDGQKKSTSLIRVDYSASPEGTLTLQGFDLINTYNPTEEASDDINNYLYNNGALRIFCGVITVKNCHIYENKTDVNEGSQSVVNLGAKLHMIDCEVHDAWSMGRDALPRARTYYKNGQDKPETNVIPQTVLERCSFYNGNSSAGIQYNTLGVYGGGIHVSAGPIYLINTTIANCHNYSTGAAMSGNKSGFFIISSSIVGNEGDRADDPNADKKYNYGSLRMEADGVVKLANSFVVDVHDNGNKGHVVYYQDSNTKDASENITSGGYNVLGTFLCYKGGAEDGSFAWQSTDLTSTYQGGAEQVKTFGKYFGSLDNLGNHGGFGQSIFPLAMQNGASVAAWFPDWVKDKIDVTVDQRGFKRDAQVTCVGAAAYEAQASDINTPKSAMQAQKTVKMMDNGRILIQANGVTYNILGTRE